MPIKTIILAVLLLTGAAWEKNADKLPEQGEPETVIEAAAPAEEWHVIENCTITHYCHGVCCNGAAYAYKPLASGAWPEAGRSVAVDRSVIPLGSEVMINGHVYIAEDTGVIGNWVDIFCDSHSEALNRGMYTTEVYWR